MVVQLQARAVPTYWTLRVFVGMVRHGPCQASGILGSKFFFSIFLNLARTITYKTTKNKQKTIKCVGCLPQSARLESLA